MRITREIVKLCLFVFVAEPFFSFPLYGSVSQDTVKSAPGGNAPVVKKISLSEAYEMYLNKTAVFADARQPFFYERAHIASSVSIHFRKADTLSVVNTLDKNQPVVVYCGGPDCDQAERLAKTLMMKGFRIIYIFTGGMDEWRAAKYPLTETEFKHK